MAKDITIKRYDATINPQTNNPIGWVELNPTTKATLVTGTQDDTNHTVADVQSILNAKQTKANLTNTISDSTTKYPTVGLLKSQIDSVVEIAEGRTATFVTTLFPHTSNNETTYYLVGGTSAIAEETIITWGTTGVLFAAVNPGDSSIDSGNFETAGGSSGDPAYLYMIYKNGNDYKVSKNVKIGEPETKNDEGNRLYSYGQDIGDILLITDVDYPDFWFANGSGSPIELQKMETAKVPLENYQLKVEAMGSETEPLYTSADGTFTTCDTYAGGTAVTLNNVSKAANTVSFYAPTGSGNTNQVLISQGNNNAPTWTDTTSTYTETGTGIFNQAGAYSLYTLVGEKANDSDVVHLSGSERITGIKTFSSGAAPQFEGGAKFKTGSNNYYVTVQANTASNNYTVTLPSSSGTLALTKQLNTTYLSAESDAPSNPITGDVWFVDVTASA